MTTPIRASRNLAGMLVLALALGAQFACPACRSLRAGEEASKPDTATADFFETKVRPLLAAHCWECHGPDKQKSGLRLDSRGRSQGRGHGAGGDGRQAEESPLVEAIGYDGAVQMPPGESLKAEIAALTDWVKRGAPGRSPGGRQAATPIRRTRRASSITAKDREFWSFRPVREPQPPAVRDEAWPRSAIDRFILAKLEARGLKPAPRPTSGRCSAA